MTPQPVAEPTSEPPAQPGADLRQPHGWEVALACPTCGVEAMPIYEGWAPNRAIHFGTTPTIFARLRCPACGARLEGAAGAKLVELFADVRISAANRRLLAAFLALTLAFEVPGIALILTGSWRELGGWLARAPLLLLGPALVWFNRRVAAFRSRCECGQAAYKFMGLLGRTSCYRCSTCGRLVRIQD